LSRGLSQKSPIGTSGKLAKHCGKRVEIHAFVAQSLNRGLAAVQTVRADEASRIWKAENRRLLLETSHFTVSEVAPMIDRLPPLLVNRGRIGIDRIE